MFTYNSVVFVVVWFIAANLVEFATINSEKLKKCSNQDFMCFNNATCIHKDQVCNYKTDCPDGSDESGPACLEVNRKQKLCSSSKGNYFQCVSNLLCLPFSSVCDGVYDCDDGSDEVNCPTIGRDCQKLCHGSHKCINRSQICNGYNDCPYGDDELLCKSNCIIHTFRCGTSFQCISENDVCNGYSDCANNADEENCTSTRSWYRKALFVNEMSECVGENRCHPCLTTSKKTDRNVTGNCSCNSGYEAIRVSESKFNQSAQYICHDINECKVYPGQLCEHLCVNTIGAYECRCHDNFVLMPNNTSRCIVQNSSHILIYTTPFHIKYFKLDMNLISNIKVTNKSEPESQRYMALDYYWGSTLKLFWSDIVSGRIMMTEYKDIDSEPIAMQEIFQEEYSYVTHIVYDHKHNNLYWYEEEKKLLCVTALDTKRTSILLFNINLVSLVISHRLSRLFWIGYQAEDQDDPGIGHIYTASLDCSTVRRLAMKRQKPSVLVLDEATSRLYWLENGAVLLTQSALLDGKDSIRILGRLGYQTNQKASLGDAVVSGTILNGRLYYAELKYWRQVLVLDREAPEKIHKLPMYLAITIKSLKRTPQNSVNATKSDRNNLCHKSKCSYICLTNIETNSVSCHCTINSKLMDNGYSCSKINSTKVSGTASIFSYDPNYPNFVRNQKLKSYKNRLIVLISILFGIPLIILAGYIVYRCEKRKGISKVHHVVFHNPIDEETSFEETIID